MSKVFEGDIIRSENDKERQYRYVTLSNDLQVLLVSHPDTEKAAACCDVRVGSFQDPKEMPGLAHFLEHMLFMGTDEYPVENIYRSVKSVFFSIVVVSYVMWSCIRQLWCSSITLYNITSK